MKSFSEKAFTLVELLIVIGIIGILAVTLLLNLNPTEAQKKARDTQRIKDINTLQAALEQYINDGNNFPDANVRESDAAADNSCSSNWLGLSLCDYMRNVPVDPRNGASIRYQRFNNIPATTSRARYRVNYDAGGLYRASTLLESASNIEKLGNDGGVSPSWFEVYNDPSVAI